MRRVVQPARGWLGERMHEALVELLERPDAASYRRAGALILSGRFDQLPAAEELAELAAFAAGGSPEAVLGQVERMMPRWALSPRVHRWAAEAAAAAGDLAGAELERFMCVCCLRGLEATGDGSPHRPYEPIYASDAYDLVAWRGQRVVRQRLVRRNGRRFDVLGCADGREVWFCAEQLLSRPALRPREAPVPLASLSPWKL